MALPGRQHRRAWRQRQRSNCQSPRSCRSQSRKLRPFGLKKGRRLLARHCNLPRHRPGRPPSHCRRDARRRRLRRAARDLRRCASREQDAWTLAKGRSLEQARPPPSRAPRLRLLLYGHNGQSRDLQHQKKRRLPRPKRLRHKRLSQGRRHQFPRPHPRLLRRPRPLQQSPLPPRKPRQNPLRHWSQSTH